MTCCKALATANGERDGALNLNVTRSKYRAEEDVTSYDLALACSIPIILID